jgi:cell division protein FtsW (lipid II flippase)
MGLKLAEILVGLVLIFCGSSLVFRAKYCEDILRKFLRSEGASTLIFSAAGIWFLGHILTLGESDFGEYKYLFFVFFLTIILVAMVKIRDFLSVRGTAILALLSANELLNAAYLEPYASRLILVTFVYAMIVGGMILGGWPYKGRDFVNFLFKNPARPGTFGLATTCYGMLVLTTVFW